MAEIKDLIEKIILGEIDGKNRAIHAYDDISWKIRTGFLTLLFGGWSVLLTGIVQSKDHSMTAYRPLVWGLFVFSLGLAFGARQLDRSYIRRKFRVIAALDRLMDALRACQGDYTKLDSELLKVAGDNPDIGYDCAGYREAAKSELSVYLAPLVTVALGILLVVQ